VSSGADDPSLNRLAGYAALGAVLFVVSAFRSTSSTGRRSERADG
jgi:hypothetical protein